MKRWFVALILTSTLVALAPAAQAAPPAPGSIGFVDTQKVFQNYKEAQDAQSRFRKEAQAYQEELAEDQRKLEDAKKAGKSPEELARMQKGFEQELKPKKARVEAMDRQLSTTIKKKIEAAIADVARARGYATVLDKIAVLFGGVDLTDDVLKKLNR